MGKKIRSAAKQKIPNVLIVGEQEVAARSVTLRRYGVEEQETLPFAEYQARVNEEIRTRSRGAG